MKSIANHNPVYCITVLSLICIRYITILHYSSAPNSPCLAVLPLPSRCPPTDQQRHEGVADAAQSGEHVHQAVARVADRRREDLARVDEDDREAGRGTQLAWGGGVQVRSQISSRLA